MAQTKNKKQNKNKQTNKQTNKKTTSFSKENYRSYFENMSHFTAQKTMLTQLYWKIKGTFFNALLTRVSNFKGPFLHQAHS